jgi:hypothetical protein
LLHLSNIDRFISLLAFINELQGIPQLLFVASGTLEGSLISWITHLSRIHQLGELFKVGANGRFSNQDSAVCLAMLARVNVNADLQSCGSS